MKFYDFMTWIWAIAWGFAIGAIGLSYARETPQRAWLLGGVMGALAMCVVFFVRELRRK